MADKLGINAAVEINSTKATKELLSGIKWVNYREMQKNMAEWRTPQMVHVIGGITKEMVCAFNDYLGGVQPVMSSGGSNGAAHSLTHWDGSEVTNGWRAPVRPNFLNYSKKKGGKTSEPATLTIPLSGLANAGDINGDGKIDVTDVSSLIKMVLNKK